MSKGFTSISNSKNGDVRYYAREHECLYIIHSKQNTSVSNLLEEWKKIEANEKFGNKDLGIRGRHDARVRTNYILSLPNELDAQTCANKIHRMIQQTPIKDCTYTIFIHKGEKEGIKNSHAHLLVNERNIYSGKKDRIMQRKGWFENTFRPLYQSTFATEFAMGKEVVKRDRLPMGLFQADVNIARELVNNYQQEAERIAQEQVEQALIEIKKIEENKQKDKIIADLRSQLNVFFGRNVEDKLSHLDYERILNGKLSPLLTVKDKNEEDRIGKVIIASKDSNGVFTFQWYRRKEHLDIGKAFLDKISDRELEWLKKYKHLGRTINLRIKGTEIAVPHYISLDLDLNMILAIAKVTIPKVLNGIELRDIEHKMLVEGKSIFVKELRVIATVDAVNKEVVFIDSFDETLAQKVADDTQTYIKLEEINKKRDELWNSKDFGRNDEAQQRNRGMRR